MWYETSSLRKDGVKYPKVDEQAVLNLLLDSLSLYGLNGTMAEPTEEVPTCVLQIPLTDLSVNGTPTMAEMFLTYLPENIAGDDPVTPLHIYLTFPMEIPEEKTREVEKYCLDSQVWLPKGAFCFYREDGVVALRDTLYIRGSYDAKQIVDMTADSLEALSMGANNSLGELLKLCEG